MLCKIVIQWVFVYFHNNTPTCDFLFFSSSSEHISFAGFNGERKMDDDDVDDEQKRQEATFSLNQDLLGAEDEEILVSKLNGIVTEFRLG